MLASAVLLGSAAGWLFGDRRLSRLQDLQIIGWPLLVAAMALRTVAPLIGDPFPVWLAAFGAISAVAILNRGVSGMWAIGLGALLNVAVVLANSAMPVDQAAAAAASALIPNDGLHRPALEDDRIALLSDRIPLLGRVYSVGDVILALGGFWVPFARLRRR